MKRSAELAVLASPLHQALRAAGAVLGALTLAASPAAAATLHVPQDYGTIAAAVDAAADGDTLRVAPGTYNESFELSGKHVILQSDFVESGDPADIHGTIIDGGSGSYVISVDNASGSGVTLQGFTLRDADDGIISLGEVVFLDGRITDTTDGIDFEGGRGTVRNSIFDQNSDDGIDLDHSTAVLIEGCAITDNGDDGVEIRLHDYVGEVLDIVIRDNLIANNGEDGIQLIDYNELSSRKFVIERNVIVDNRDAGVGLMCCEDTSEDFQGAPIAEPILLLGNTIVGNDYGFVGGVNVMAANNLFSENSMRGVRRVGGDSIIDHSLFWAKGQDMEDSNVVSATSVVGDPMLSPDVVPQAASAAVDAGTDLFVVEGEVILALEPSQWSGAAPDVGAREFDCEDPDDCTPPVGGACDDGLDNDGDGHMDFGADPGCDDAADPSERSAALACDDGIDNDGDGPGDYPADAGCYSATDSTEETNCGMGPELLVLLPPLLIARRRRARAGA